MEACCSRRLVCSQVVPGSQYMSVLKNIKLRQRAEGPDGWSLHSPPRPEEQKCFFGTGGCAERATRLCRGRRRSVAQPDAEVDKSAAVPNNDWLAAGINGDEVEIHFNLRFRHKKPTLRPDHEGLCDYGCGINEDGSGANQESDFRKHKQRSSDSLLPLYLNCPIRSFRKFSCAKEHQ